MTLADYQFLFEIISTLSVIISILYLGYQIRQNTRTMRRTAARDLVQDLNELGRYFIEKPDLVALYFQASQQPEALSEQDRFRFGTLLKYVFSNFDLALSYHEDRLISAESVETYTRGILALLESPAVLAWWESEGKGLYSEALRSRINGRLAG